uniref:Scyreptin n=1 Tax=Scylla paramamosain TaxID=85552 RepID=AMP_SCYPA
MRALYPESFKSKVAMYSGAWCGCRPRTRQLSGRLGRGTCGGRQPASRSADFSCECVLLLPLQDPSLLPQKLGLFAGTLVRLSP